jgi:hypothetical protein
MSIVLNFEFLVILNLLVTIAWPASGTYTRGPEAPRPGSSVLGYIMLFLTVVAAIADIVFLAVRIGH